MTSENQALAARAYHAARQDRRDAYAAALRAEIERSRAATAARVEELKARKREMDRRLDG